MKRFEVSPAVFQICRIWFEFACVILFFFLSASISFGFLERRNEGKKISSSVLTYSKNCIWKNTSIQCLFFFK